MSDFDLDDVTRKVSGLHFAKETLSDQERETLHLAEALLAEVRRLTEQVMEIRSVLDDRRLWIFPPNPEEHDKAIEVGIIRHLLGDRRA